MWRDWGLDGLTGCKLIISAGDTISTVPIVPTVLIVFDPAPPVGAFMSIPAYNVLFLCTRNSARSIIAEALLNHSAGTRFKAFSAGSYPSGRVDPYAIEQLRIGGIAVDGLRSKSWNEFAAPSAPEMHFIFTVCDGAAQESCPIWPGQPITAHWGVPDPAQAKGSEEVIRRAFLNAYALLSRRIGLFTSLKLEALGRLALRERLTSIGSTTL